MVVFGAPESMTLAQQTDRAVQLGFRINEVIGQLPTEHGLSARVGINTGKQSLEISAVKPARTIQSSAMR